MNSFKGKKLLELGTNVASVDIVKYAKSKGAYIIVADYFPIEKSEAKRYADESYNISTLDIDSLCNLAKEKKIDGVFCGVSEANILATNEIASCLNIHSYFTQSQWNHFMNKENFRDLCNKYKVCTPQTFFKGNANEIRDGELNDIIYPVIIKPVDNRANSGISICEKKEELDQAIKHATANSKINSIIIEEFVDGIEISSTYVIQDGIVRLVCFGSKYPYENNNKLKALSHAYVYPSAYLTEYMQKIDTQIIQMIKGEGLCNGTIFFQGIYKNGEFYIFEAGLRMEGTASYRITEKMNGQNFMHYMVDNSLKIKTDYDINKEDPYFNGKKCVVFTQIAHGGTISRIEGYDEIKKNPIVVSSEKRHSIGDSIKEDGTLRQIMFRYVLVAEQISEIIDFIKNAQKKVLVYDENNKPMLIDSFNPFLIVEEYNR